VHADAPELVVLDVDQRGAGADLLVGDEVGHAVDGRAGHGVLVPDAEHLVERALAHPRRDQLVELVGTLDPLPGGVEGALVHQLGAADRLQQPVRC
jgi:hypothetical protein